MLVSLRARLVVGLLVLAAVGLVLLGAVTYAEQHSFLYARLDQQVRSAQGVISRALDDAGYGTARGDHGRGGRPPPVGGGPGGPHGPGGPVNLAPPGTYGERRTTTGKVLGHVVFSYGQQARATPAIPARLAVGQMITVGSRGSGGENYRVVATSDFDDSGITVVAVPTRDVDQTLHRLLRVEGLVIGGVLLALAAVALLLVRLGLRPLDRMAAAAGEIAAGRLSRRVSPSTPRTEVGRLGIALNAMLERLERAFGERQASEDRLRQFLADASHELRTPLSSIRGYAELFRMGATGNPGETAKAMQRIEDEARRMGILVEDLLTLARLDEVREATREPVDLGELAQDAVADARVTAPDRDVALHRDGPAVVLGDQHQLRQVLGNLLRNALVHTPPGTPIEVTVDGDGGDVAVAVRDHGPGLPHADPTLLFERFWRAEGGRARGKGGAGLGLAIVGVVVDAHGGHVEAGNAQDGGARFVVYLPRA